MDTKKQLTLAWAVAGVLAIALIVALVALMNQDKDLGSVLQEGREDLTEQRDRIAAACESTDTESQERCQDELNRLSDLLREFSQNIERAAPAPAEAP